MNTIAAPKADSHRRRRRHNPEFKADAIAACSQPGVSIAAVAMSRGLNANLLRRWVADAETDFGASDQIAPDTTKAPAFVALSLPPPTLTPTPTPTPTPPIPPAPTPDIRIELRRAASTVNIAWPGHAAAECAAWLKEWLR